jgi:hypothetical protein
VSRRSSELLLTYPNINSQSTNFGICLGNGDGTFRAGSLHNSTAGQLSRLAVLDVDGDGVQASDDHAAHALFLLGLSQRNGKRPSVIVA